MFDDQPVESLTIAGVIFLVFMAITVITAFCLYPFVTSFFDAFNNADFGSDINTKRDDYSPIIEASVTIVFAIAIAFPVTWFISWVFSREVDVGYIRRY